MKFQYKRLPPAPGVKGALEDTWYWRVEFKNGGALAIYFKKPVLSAANNRTGLKSVPKRS